MTTPVILVTPDDEVIGHEGKLAVHRQGLLHRAFSVLLYRERAGQIEALLQQRHARKYHTGGLWTNTCCSHPHLDEDTAIAARRRLMEETGIDTPLNAIGQFRYYASFVNGLIEHELDHVFIGQWDELPTTFDPEEIEVMKWVSLTSLQKDLEDHPYRYTPWLSQVLKLSLPYFQIEPVKANRPQKHLDSRGVNR